MVNMSESGMCERERKNAFYAGEFMVSVNQSEGASRKFIFVNSLTALKVHPQWWGRH